MVAMLKNPPKQFETVIRAHFRQRKDAILAQCDKWASQLNRANLKVLIEELKPLLEENAKLSS